MKKFHLYAIMHLYHESFLVNITNLVSGNTVVCNRYKQTSWMTAKAIIGGILGLVVEPPYCKINKDLQFSECGNKWYGQQRHHDNFYSKHQTLGRDL